MPIRSTLLAFIAFVFVVSGILYSVFRTSSAPEVQETTDFLAGFSFEIATTTAARERGLSGRASIPENYGMLFVFETPGRYGIWMHEMLIPIDIIWLTGDGRIVDIDPEVSPDTYPEVFYPPSAVSFVLETKAGEAARQGFDVGTVLSLPK